MFSMYMYVKGTRLHVLPSINVCVRVYVYTILHILFLHCVLYVKEENKDAGVVHSLAYIRIIRECVYVCVSK